mmetsp:Transcript_27538/g.58836  ORF Transcript_27538/g.58836 Transcript_27538/m.58836 type:complete len:155 (-) Transcript_27538:1052-1516(-)
MERSLAKVKVAYGGSFEHDCLLLSAQDGDSGSCASNTDQWGIATTVQVNEEIFHPCLRWKLQRILRAVDHMAMLPMDWEGSLFIIVNKDGKNILKSNRSTSFDGTVPKPPLQSQNNKLFIVLGWNLSSYTYRNQFLISATETFGFSILYDISKN